MSWKSKKHINTRILCQISKVGENRSLKGSKKGGMRGTRYRLRTFPAIGGADRQKGGMQQRPALDRKACGGPNGVQRSLKGNALDKKKKRASGGGLDLV